MTLNCFAKEIFQKELKIDGKYVWKNNCLYCLTPGDFLLRIYLERQSFGHFGLYLFVIPLIAPIRFDVMGKNLVSIDCTGIEIASTMLRSGYTTFPACMPFFTMCSKDPESSYSVCAEMIQMYVNPYFEKVRTIRDYYDIEMADVEKRWQMDIHRDEYSFPNNCNWYNTGISARPYVYAFVRDYEDALSFIHVSCKNSDGFTKERYAELEQAILSDDPNALEMIFNICYKDNQTLIGDFLKLDLPERDRFVL